MTNGTSTSLTSLWRLIEIYHAVVYFAPERRKHYEALGLKGGWMGYFATRGGALGVVSPKVVTACFYNFNEPMVERALPDAWSYTTPALACQARLSVFDEAIQRLLGQHIDSRHMDRAAHLGMEAANLGVVAGRPLYAAHVALQVPSEPHLALFWATAALREYRGDAHIIALAEAEVDGCEANVLMAALGLVGPEQRTFRGWGEEDWQSANDRLSSRGWLNREGKVTKAGERARAEIERTTDRLSRGIWDSLGVGRTSELAALLAPLATRLVDAGALPYPNAIGMPPIAELSPTST